MAFNKKPLKAQDKLIPYSQDLENRIEAEASQVSYEFIPYGSPTFDGTITKIGNMVFFSGTVNIGSNLGVDTTLEVGRLPSAVRPTTLSHARGPALTQTNRPDGAVTVTSDGNVTIINRSTAPRTWFSFSLFWKI